MVTLLIDTHYLDITLVLYQNGVILQKLVKTTQLDHSMFIIPMIDELLMASNMTVDDIKEIIVINGPGSFTGVRLGVTIGKTFAYLRNLPIYAVSYLEAMAISSNATEASYVLADKNGYFVATFDADIKLQGDYGYIPKNEFEMWKKDKCIVEGVTISFEKLYDYVKSSKPVIHPHELKPLYIKKIEVQHA